MQVPVPTSNEIVLRRFLGGCTRHYYEETDASSTTKSRPSDPFKELRVFIWNLNKKIVEIHSMLSSTCSYCVLKPHMHWRGESRNTMNHLHLQLILRLKVVVMHMHKRLQCIHGTCVFQVQLLQGWVPDPSCLRMSSLASQKCWNPLFRSKKPTYNLNEGTYRPEYYMTMHRHTLVTQCGMPCNLQHTWMLFVTKARVFQHNCHNNPNNANNRNNLQ